MNTERLLELADRIEKLPHQPIVERYTESTPTAFNMGTWHCGSVCCIGGWAEAIWSRRPAKRPDNQTFAGWVLGLDDIRADQLFYPEESTGWDPLRATYADITPAMAAEVIRDLAETGAVHWSIAARQLEREHAA